MKYKTLKVIKDNFEVTQNNRVFGIETDIRDGHKNRIEVVTPVEKGFIYGCLYFYDLVEEQIGKLYKKVTDVYQEVKDKGVVKDDNMAEFFIEVCEKAEKELNNDQLEGIVKDVVTQDHQNSLILTKTPEEEEILNGIKEGYINDAFESFYASTFAKAEKKDDELWQINLSSEFMQKLTSCQKKFILPALVLCALKNGKLISDINITKNAEITYKEKTQNATYEETEEKIKSNIKKILERLF